MEKERKLQIIRAALKRFIRHGLSKTTLDEVARDLRIGKATLYHYFTSKEDLYYQTLRYEISQYLDEVDKIFQSEEEWQTKLGNYISLRENISTKYKLIFDLVIQIITDAEYRHEKEIFNEMAAGEEKILKDAFASKAKRDFPPEHYAVFLNRLSWAFSFNSNFQSENKNNDSPIKNIFISTL